MAVDKKISELSSGAPAQAGDEYVVARSGANYKLTLTNIAASMPPIGATTPNTGAFTTVDATNVEVTNVKAKDGTAAITIADSTGNVGIGTTAPSEKLEVVGNLILDTNDANIKLKSGITGTTGALNFTFNSDSTVYGSVSLPYDTRTTVGVQLQSASGYPITIASGNGVIFSEDGSETMRIDSSGRVGIGGTAAAFSKLAVAGTLPTSSNIGVGVDIVGTIPSGTTSIFDGVLSRSVTAAASFTLTNLNNFRAVQGTLGAGSTVTNQFGFVADSTLTGATNNYGFYGNIASGSNRYNVYMAGTADNYFAGSVGIGTAPVAVAKVIMGGTLPSSGAASQGFRNIGQIPSATTSNYIGFFSFPTTEAASFTLTGLRHFSAGAQAFGAGSAVTSQYGFEVANSLTGATNNYGFYSNIASGANRWNFYAAGTAQNYMAGNLLLGVTSVGYTTKFVSRGSTSDSSAYHLYGETSAGTYTFAVRNDGKFYTGIAASSPYNDTTANAANVVVDSAGILQRSTSSLRYKSEIANATHGLADVLKLRSVTYKAKNSGDTLFGGLIAEEVHDAGLTEFVAYDKEGRPDAIHYGNMVALLVKAVQELTARVAELEAK